MGQLRGKLWQRLPDSLDVLALPRAHRVSQSERLCYGNACCTESWKDCCSKQSVAPLSTLCLSFCRRSPSLPLLIRSTGRSRIWSRRVDRDLPSVSRVLSLSRSSFYLGIFLSLSLSRPPDPWIVGCFALSSTHVWLRVSGNISPLVCRLRSGMSPCSQCDLRVAAFVSLPPFAPSLLDLSLRLSTRVSCARDSGFC